MGTAADGAIGIADGADGGGTKPTIPPGKSEKKAISTLPR